MSDSLVQPQKYKEIKWFSSKKHLGNNFWSQLTNQPKHAESFYDNNCGKIKVRVLKNFDYNFKRDRQDP